MAEEKNENKSAALPPVSGGAPEPAKLPSFKSSLSKKGSPGKESTGGASVVPTWGGASAVDKLAGAPMFRGAGVMAGKKSLLGRLKALKTKDMAFIAAGLGVLVMAPVAEFLISDGNDNAKSMTEGFDRKGGFFAEPQDLYEAGVEGIAPGGLMGQDTDVITPLNVRDPSSLIMGPNNAEKVETPQASVDEPKRDAPKDDTDWKKIIDSAKSGATEATKKVKLPRPNAKLAGALSGLKGLAGGGNTRAALQLAAPKTPGSANPSGARSSLSRTQSVPGFRGAGGRGLASGTGAPFAGGYGGFGPGGTSGSDTGMPGGGINGGGNGTGFGAPNGEGSPTKSPGGNNFKDNKTLGENLEFLRRKMNMEKAIDLKWAKKRYNELERKKMIEQTAIQTAQQAFLKILDRLLKGNEGEKGGGGSGGGSPGGGKEDPKAPPGEGQGTAQPVGDTGSQAGKVESVANPAKRAAASAGRDMIGAGGQFDSAKGQVTLWAEKLPADHPLKGELAKLSEESLAAYGKDSPVTGAAREAGTHIRTVKNGIDAEVKRLGDVKTKIGEIAGKAKEESRTEYESAQKDGLPKELKEGKEITGDYDPSAAAKALRADAEKAKELEKKVGAVLGKVPTSLDAVKIKGGGAETELATLRTNLTTMESEAGTWAAKAEVMASNLEAVQKATTEAKTAVNKQITSNDTAISAIKFPPAPPKPEQTPDAATDQKWTAISTELTGKVSSFDAPIQSAKQVSLDKLGS